MFMYSPIVEYTLDSFYAFLHALQYELWILSDEMDLKSVIMEISTEIESH